jgi:hypothetical protein
MATYRELYNSARTDTQLNARMQVAISKYARYVLGLASPDATLLTWAKKAVSSAGALQYSDAMVVAAVSDPGYSTATADTEAGDTALQTIVETLVNNQFKNL